MANPPLITYKNITYVPQYQPPTWQDKVTPVVAEGPDGINMQFQGLRDELDALSSVVKQMSATLSSISQAVGLASANVTSANTIVSGINASANAAKIKWGSINADGSIASGSNDFTVKKVANLPGVYDIFFQTAFSSIPIVLATQIALTNTITLDLTSQGGSTLDNAVVIAITVNQCRLKVGDNAGNGNDRCFSFLAYNVSA